MKYLFFLPHYPSFCWSGVYGILLDQLECLAREGHTIRLIHCNDCQEIGPCYHLKSKPSAVCRLCRLHKNYLLKHLSGNIEQQTLSPYSQVISTEKHSFDYSSVSDIKQLKYKGVSIGYAAFSTYLSFVTRNLSPLIDDDFRRFFDELLARCCRFTDVVEAALDQYQPDSVGLFNSRLIDNRPIVDLCKNRHIDFCSYEHKMVLGNQPRKTCFRNSTPHDTAERTRQMNEEWNSTDVPMEEKIRLAETFFENRRRAVAAGDKVYVQGQQAGRLPDDWDKSKHNIVIFNSSEDEFASVGELYERDNLFPSQMEGLHSIFEAHKERHDLHFYLRIHPNLKNVNYLFHTLLHRFGERYSNVTVIAADSPISTYSLIDHADKVIVFGSTTGAEAVYWGKPTLLLGNAIYRQLNICYVPHTVDEMHQLISNKSLPAKGREEVLKVGYHFLGQHAGEFQYFKVCNKVYHLAGRPIRIQSFLIDGAPCSNYHTAWSQFSCKLLYESLPQRSYPCREDASLYDNVMP